MKKKDLLFVTAVVNAGLLSALFIFGLTSSDKKIDLVKQLDQTKPAMLQVQPIFSENLEDQKEKDTIVYQLPKAPVKAVASTLPNPTKSDSSKLDVTKSESLKLVKVVPEKTVEKLKDSIVEVVVVKNDTLEALSRKHNSTVEKIIAHNDLKSPLLKIGQVLNIPRVEKKSKAKSVAKVVKKETSQFYTVKVGDNPWTIAMKHHMKVKTLLDLNDLDDKSSRKIRPGNKLRVR